MTSLTVKKDNC